MTIALKLFAFVSAVYLAYFDFSKIQLMLQNPSSEVALSLVSYFFVPVGLLTAIYYLTSFLENKKIKKIMAVTLMVFSGIHCLLKIVDLVLNLIEGTFTAPYVEIDTTYQGFMWVAQILLLISVFILGLSCFKTKLQPISAYVLVLGVVAYFLTYAYYIYAGGYSLELLFTESEISFMLTECLVPIGYLGIYLKEIWLDNEILR